MDPLGDARRLLPGWVTWSAALVYPLAAALLALVAGGLGAAVALRPWRGAAGTHWTERARRSLPARLYAPVVSGALPAMAAVGALAYCGPASRVPVWAVGFLALVPSLFVAGWLASRIEERVAGPLPPLRRRLLGGLTVNLVLYPHLLVSAAAAALLPDRFNAVALAGLAVVFLFYLAVLAGGGITLGRLLGTVRPASPRLQAIVERAVARVGVRPRRVLEVAWHRANAFAFPQHQSLGFTEGALEILTDEELEAVCAHELGHLGEPRRVVLARSVAIFLLFPLAAVRPLLGTWGPAGVVAAFALMYLGAFAVQRPFQRLEQRADALGLAHQGEEGTYARALARIYEHNLVPAVMAGKRQIHPHLYDRLEAAGVPPDYPRPAPPPSWPGRIGFAVALLVFVAGLFGPKFWIIKATRSKASGESAVLLSLAAGGGHWDLSELAWLHSERGDLGGAVRLYRAATTTSRKSVYDPAALAIALADLGRCEEAAAALREARRRGQRYGADSDDRSVLDDARSAVGACTAGALPGRKD